MIKKTVNKAKKYFDQSKTVKKWGAATEKVPTSIGNLRKNLADMETESWYGTTVKWTGVSLLIALQALAKSIKILGVDNLMLRTVEIEFSKMNVGKNKKGNDKAFSAFIKKHPWIPAYVVNYMMMAGVLFGANVGGVRDTAFEKVKDIFSKSDKEIQDVNINDIKISPTDTYEEFLAQCKPITPYLISYLANPEGFEKNVYKDGRGVWTIGYGSTRLKNGPVGPSTSSMTIDQAYETARWHAEDYETYFVLYCYCCAFDKDITAKEFLGLASFVYNGGPGMFEPDKSEKVKDKTTLAANKKDNRIRNDRWWNLRKLYRKNGTISRLEIKELFAKYPVKSKGSVFQAWLDGKSGHEIGNKMTNYLRSGSERAEGLVWRRWLEACLTSGDIDPIDVMNCPIGGVYEFRKYMESKGTELITTDNKMNYKAATEFKQWIKDPKYWDKKAKKLYTPKNVELTKSVMPKEIVALCENGKCEVLPPKTIGFLDSDTIAQKEPTPQKSSELVELGTKYLYDGNYEKAEEYYKAAIKADPNNALAYSDLSYTYLKWGKYEDGAAVARDLIANKNKITDTSALAGTYYNAGLCRKGLAESGKNVLKNYKNAKINMEHAKKLLPRVKKYQEEIDAISKEISKLENKKLSFNSAGVKVSAKPSDNDNKTLETYELISLPKGRA